MAKGWHVEKEFECLGLKCVVAFMKLGHRCGYVGVPVGHKLYGVDYNEVDFSCHGGLTYSGGGANSEYPIKSDLWWFGFDCAHYMDASDYELAMKYFPEEEAQLRRVISVENKFPTHGTIRTEEYVANECMELAKQIKEGED